MNDLFATLSPPPGGVETLRRRLHRSRHRARQIRTFRRAAVATSLALAAGLGLWRIERISVENTARPFGDERWSLSALLAGETGSTPAAVRTARDARGRQALLAVDARDPDVLLFWIETLER